MSILVTGGAGYIGSVVAAHLIESGYKVIVFDNLSLGHHAAVHQDAIFEYGDLASKTQVHSLFARHKITAVMHFASRSQVGESMDSPFKYLSNNVIEGLNLIEAAASAGVKQFILSSTASLYECSTAALTELVEIRPYSPYAESKHYLERVLHWMEVTVGMRHAVLRYFNASGATATLGEDHRPETHLIPLVLRAALNQGPITVFGDDYDTRDGTCVRDYIHVSDIASAHLLALQALPQGSRTYNLGSGHGYTVLEVISAAKLVTGRPIQHIIEPRRPGDSASLIASSAKIKAELGWEPKLIGLETIIRSAWDWYRTHPHGYDDDTR